MNEEDRDTNPDARSPYECILADLNELKVLSRASAAACATIGPRVQRLELMGLTGIAVALALAACEIFR